ncbi:phage head spike fiber domain-containing protein [Azospirillum palustre]
MLTRPLPLMFGPRGGGRLRPVLNLDFLSGSVDSRISFTRASTATYFDANGVMQAAAINQPRFDFDPATLQPRGVLIEAQATNFLVRSREFGAANWFTFGTVSVAADAALAPDGTMTADRLTIASGSGIYQSATVTTGTYADGIWLRADSNISVEVGSNDPGGAFVKTTCNVTTTWTRFFVSKTTAYTTLNIQVNGPATVYAWQGQLESGSVSTSDIFTTTASVTRSADICSMSLSSAPGLSVSEGSLFVEFETLTASNGGNQFVCRLSDGTYNNQIAANIQGGGIELATASGGTYDGLAQAGAIPAGTVVKFAAAWKSNDLAATVNGGSVVADSSATIPSGLTRLDIGHDHNGSNHAVGLRMRRLRLYPIRQPNAVLQGMTA